MSRSTVFRGLPCPHLSPGAQKRNATLCAVLRLMKIRKPPPASLPKGCTGLHYLPILDYTLDGFIQKVYLSREKSETTLSNQGVSKSRVTTCHTVPLSLNVSNRS